MQELAQLVGTVGFPAAIALFVLVRLERRLKELTDAIAALKIEVVRLRDRAGA